MERKKRHRITFLLVNKVEYLICSFDSKIHPYSLDYIATLSWGHVLAQKKYFLHFRLVFSLIHISLSKKDHISAIVLYLCCTSISSAWSLQPKTETCVLCQGESSFAQLWVQEEDYTVCSSAKNVLLFATCASSILENTPNPGDISKLEKSKETSQSSTRNSKPCTWERAAPDITVSWGAISRKAAWQKGPWGDMVDAVLDVSQQCSHAARNAHGVLDCQQGIIPL